jgi:protein DGCR14
MMSIPKKRQRRHVLPEDEFMSTLSSIVQRDYFPDLAELQKKAAVLSRRDVGDFAGAVAVRRAARSLQLHEEALAQEEEDNERNFLSDGARQNARPLHRESLTGFHARVTSEDNHEFEQSQQHEVRENRERVNEVFGFKPKALTDGREVYGATPLLASDQFNRKQDRIVVQKNNSSGNSFFFSPDHGSLYNEESIPGASPLLLQNGPLKYGIQEFPLMPPPAPKQKSAAGHIPKQEMVQFIPKQTLEKRIEPSRTRFLADIIVPQSFYRNENDSSTTDYSTDASTDLDRVAEPLHLDRKARSKRQKRDQQSFVAMTPLIVPGRAGESASPIITWGTVNSTPMVLGGMGTTMTTHLFSMPEESNEDKAARLAEAKLAERSKKSRPDPPLVHRIASLTPAAKSLLAKTTRGYSSSVRAGSAFGSALRLSYTPQSKSQGSSIRNHLGKSTPRVAARDMMVPPSSGHPTEYSPVNGSLTDGLLKF